MESFEYIVLLILIIVALWIFLSLSSLKHRNVIFVVVSFILLWIFLSVRKPYSDMTIYIDYFNSLDVDNFEVIFKNDWEILFKALLYCIRLITDDSRVMIFIVALITLLGPFLFIKRYSRNYLLSVVMFVSFGSFYMQFFILRQAIAISIFLMAFHFIEEKKLFKYCFSIALAVLFHKTALILLLLYPLTNIRPSKYKNILIFSSSLVCLFFGAQIADLLMTDFYNQYSGGVSSGEGVWLFLVYFVMYISYYLLEQRMHKKEKEVITKTSLFTILMQFFAMQNNAFCRIANYTRDSFCVLIPNTIQEIQGRDRVLFSIVVIILCICFAAVTDVIGGYSIL